MFLSFRLSLILEICDCQIFALQSNVAGGRVSDPGRDFLSFSSLRCVPICHPVTLWFLKDIIKTTNNVLSQLYMVKVNRPLVTGTKVRLLAIIMATSN